MKATTLHRIPILFEQQDADATEVIKTAAERSTEILQEKWGLQMPDDIRIYVMTSGQSFIFKSAPWFWQVILVPTYPLWIWRVNRFWRIAGGWVQRYGSRYAVGIKPPRLLEVADSSLGKRIFVQEDDLEIKVEHITCHELTHGFTAGLRLPAWLNEGLAMVTVDQYAGHQTVLQETLTTLVDDSRAVSPQEYRRLDLKDHDGLIFLYSRGYWITRYFDETQPALLRQILQERRKKGEIILRLSDAVGLQPDKFWAEINQIVFSHFN